MNSLSRHRALTRIWASEPGWKGCFTTVNHTDLGRMFLFVAVVFFVIGGILAMLIRAQLATPRSAFMGPDIYNQVFTMHGTIMMFLFAIPVFEGLAVYLLPKILGTRDLAFPRLTAYGFWCYAFGGSLLLISLVFGHRARQRLVHVPAALLQDREPRHQHGLLASRGHLRGDLRDLRRRRDLSDSAALPRARHEAVPDADLRLVCAGHRGDDSDGASRR
jgi:hypothetical protein